MNAADIYRYSNRGDVDTAIRAMQERIVEELRADRGRMGSLFTQDANGREEYRPRLGRTEAWQEAWAVTAQHYRDEYMRGRGVDHRRYRRPRPGQGHRRDHLARQLTTTGPDTR